MHTAEIDLTASRAAEAPAADVPGHRPPARSAAPASQPADAVLIGAAASGDTAAFEQLYRRHAGRVYGLCLRLTCNRADAQDATQETFVNAWRQLATFRGESGFATWLHRIALNQVLGKKRRAATEAHRLEILARESRASHDGPELEDHLERGIAQLPQRAREVFVLQRIYGYTHEEVADLLDIAVGTCKAQVHRADQLLVAILGGRP